MKQTVGRFISRAAEVLGVPASTLRYYEKEGLIEFNRNSENNYREPSMQDLLQLLDIIMYRSLNIPIAEIKSCMQADMPTLNELFDKSAEAVKKNIEFLSATALRINERKSILEKASRLSEKQPSVISAALPSTSAFSYDNKSDIKLMLTDCTRTGIEFETRNGKPSFIVFETSCSHNCEKQYVYGPLFVDSSTQTAQNAEEFYRYAERLGKRSGKLTARYLITASLNGVRTDFCEGYLELIC